MSFIYEHPVHWIQVIYVFLGETLGEKMGSDTRDNHETVQMDSSFAAHQNQETREEEIV